MFKTLAIALLMQTAAIGPRTGSGYGSTSCPILTVTGQLVFPAFVAPVHFVNIELHSLDDPYAPARETFTGPYEQFRFGGVPSGEYEILIIMAGMDVVRQHITLTRDTCSPSPGAHFLVPLHKSPAIKLSPIAEDAVSIETLMNEVPRKTVSTFDKLMEKESGEDPALLVPALQEIVKTAPSYYEANLELGLEYKKDNKQNEAIPLLTHALELNSASMFARSALGQYRFEAGNYQEAADMLGEAVRLGSTSPDVYYMLGTSFYRLGQLALAEVSLLRALDINPTIGKAHLQLYNVYMKGQLPQKALSAAKTYLDEFPNAKDRDYVRSMVEKRDSTIKPAGDSDKMDVITQTPQTVDAELDAVIHRATEYVTKYEDELGNLIGTEDYLQTATQLKRTNPRLPPVVTRRTSSDFMLIKVGSDWVALREVNLLNGKKVTTEQKPLESAFNGTPEANTRLFNSLKADSIKYNVGPVLRENNLPTFALHVLRKEEVARFWFERDGTEKIDGVTVWRVKFREARGPTMVRNRTGDNLFSTGTLWIEPNTGKVLKTDLRVANEFATPPIHTSVVVTYGQDKTQDTLLPRSMVEHYKTENDDIECHADYSKFHSFRVDVKFDQKPGP